MPIHVLSTTISNALPTQFYVPSALVLLGIAITRAWASGRANSRDRDMHGRVVLITGGFTPLGLVLLSELSSRGAQLIALTPNLSSPSVVNLIPLLRQTTSNELIFAEECDVESHASIQQFCTNFLRTSPSEGKEPPRLDAIVFAHGYTHIQGVNPSSDELRERTSLASFLITTLLLPSLLRAPSDRDIRLIHVVNPFYAASVPSFNPLSPPTTSRQNPTISTWSKEGYRSLQTILFAKHLQRVLNALVTTPPVPDPAKPNQPVQAASSNILSMSVCPGFSRSDTIAPVLRADRVSPHFSTFGLIAYLICLPILSLITKSPTAAIQSVLYALFVPHPFKSQTLKAQGGALYRECDVVSFPEGVTLEEDESVGRAVWEGLERGLKVWEEAEKQSLKEMKAEGDEKKAEKERLKEKPKTE